MVVAEEGWSGGKEGETDRGSEVVVSEPVTADQFENSVARKYQDSMLGFHTEFMVSGGKTLVPVIVSPAVTSGVAKLYSLLHHYRNNPCVWEMNSLLLYSIS